MSYSHLQVATDSSFLDPVENKMVTTSGQVGAILSPILVAQVMQRFSHWSAPLYLTGVLFLLGALCWIWVDPTKPVSD